MAGSSWDRGTALACWEANCVKCCWVFFEYWPYPAKCMSLYVQKRAPQDHISSLSCGVWTGLGSWEGLRGDGGFSLGGRNTRMSLSPGWEVISCPLLTIKVLHQPYLLWPECVLVRLWGGGSCKMWRTALPVAAAVSSFASPLIKLIVHHPGFWHGGVKSQLSISVLTWISRLFFWLRNHFLWFNSRFTVIIIGCFQHFFFKAHSKCSYSFCCFLKSLCLCSCSCLAYTEPIVVNTDEQRNFSRNWIKSINVMVEEVEGKNKVRKPVNSY